jgi:hypothetical protein
LAEGETDPRQLARLGDERLQCSEEQGVDALTGRVQPNHRAILGLQLERLQLIDRSIDQPIAELNRMIAQAMKAHPDAVIRLAEPHTACKRRGGFSTECYGLFATVTALECLGGQ